MGKMPFNQMENIGNYLKFAGSLGVKPSDMCVSFLKGGGVICSANVGH